MSIREALPSDIARIVELGSRSLIEGPYKDQLADRPDVTTALAQKLVEMGNAKILVSETPDGIVGLFAFIVFAHYYSGETVAGEMIWYVIPEARKSNIALELLWAAERLAHELGAKKMQLTAPTDEIAGMYQKLRGYRKVETAFQRAI
jgi:GNAT superfamily N-acetyltransferase